MPIQGLSDEQTRNDTPVSYPTWAKVKKGAEKPERGVGRNLDYFRFEWLDSRAEAIFTEMYGEQPDSLPIVTLGATVDATFDSYYRMYTSNNALQRKCDGCTILRASDADLIGRDCMCDPVDIENKAKGVCLPKGYLYFTIPDLCFKVGYVGQFILGTGSPIEIREMASCLQTVQNTVGTLENQQFILQRSERTFDVDLKGDGRNSKITQFMVELVPPVNNIIKLDTPTRPAIENTATKPLQVDGGQLPQLSSPQGNDADPQAVEGMNDTEWGLFMQLMDTLTGMNFESAWAEVIQSALVGVPDFNFLREQQLYTAIQFSLEWIADLNYEFGIETLDIMGVDLKFKVLHWDSKNNRHYAKIGNEHIYIYSRDPFRNANMDTAYLAEIDKRSYDFMSQLNAIGKPDVSHLPSLVIQRKTDDMSGQTRYFYAEHVRLPKAWQQKDSQEVVGDIPF